MRMEKRWNLISVMGFALMAGSILLMPMEYLGFLPGILFWLGLLLGIAFQICIGVRRRKQNKQEKSKRDEHRRIWLFSNGAASVVDGICLVWIPLTAVVLYRTHGIGYGCFVLLSVCVMLIILHFLLNGKNFAFLYETEQKGRYRKKSKRGIHVREEIEK